MRTRVCNAHAVSSCLSRELTVPDTECLPSAVGDRLHIGWNASGNWSVFGSIRCLFLKAIRFRRAVFNDDIDCSCVGRVAEID